VLSSRTVPPPEKSEINSETFDYSNILTSDNSLDYCRGMKWQGKARETGGPGWILSSGPFEACPPRQLLSLLGLPSCPRWPIVPSLVRHFILAARSSASGLRLPHSEKWQKFNDAFKLHVARPPAPTPHVSFAGLSTAWFDELYALQCLFASREEAPRKNCSCQHVIDFHHVVPRPIMV